MVLAGDPSDHGLDGYRQYEDGCGRFQRPDGPVLSLASRIKIKADAGRADL